MTWREVIDSGQCVCFTDHGDRCSRSVDYGFGKLGGVCGLHAQAIFDIRRWHDHQEALKGRAIERLNDRAKTVYYVRQQDYIKIGFASNLRGRLKAISENRTSRPLDLPIGPVVLLATHTGGRDAERAIHARFRHLRVSGEWFEAAQDLIEHVEHVAARNLRRAAA